MGLVLDLNQLGGDSYFFRIASNAALKHILDAEFMRDLFQGCLRILVVHDRGASDYAEMLRIHPPELSNHLLRQPVAEVFLPGVSGKIVEGKNREHRPRGLWRSGSRLRPLTVADERCGHKGDDPKNHQPPPPGMAFACRWRSSRRGHFRGSLDCGFGFVQRDLLHVGQEAVAAPSHRLDVAGMGRGVIESAPNLVDGAADVVIEINEGALRPETLAELL